MPIIEQHMERTALDREVSGSSVQEPNALHASIAAGIPHRIDPRDNNAIKSAQQTRHIGTSSESSSELCRCILDIGIGSLW